MKQVISLKVNICIELVPHNLLLTYISITPVYEQLWSRLKHVSFVLLIIVSLVKNGAKRCFSAISVCLL